MQQLRAVDVDFFETAPHRLVFREPVRATPDRVFAAISADPSTWSWFDGVHDASYGSAPPHGVGTARAIKMGDDVYRETIIAWDKPARWAYRVDETTAPMFGALAEDWRVRPDGAGSIVEWTFAFDPTVEGEAIVPVLPEILTGVFRAAMQGLDAHLAQD
jgi:Polyketide cyclase / dehydrase and lipid transport